MKKNKMMRLASFLLIAVLITTSTISGTYAKYVTTGSADDTARVAKWGVEVIADAEDTAFAKTYNTSDTNNTAEDNIPDVVVSSNDFVVAPGTSSEEVNGNLIFGVTGKPEVAANIKVEFTGDDIYYGTYHPIKFTLHVMDTNSKIDLDTYTWQDTAKFENLTLADLQSKISENFGGTTGFYTEPNEQLDALYKITWEWPYEQDNHDAHDTALGDLIADGKLGEGNDTKNNYNTVLNYGVTITVTQVD